MIVFKLERERPAYIANSNDSLFYVKDKYVRACEFSSSRDIPVLSIRSRSGASGKIRSLSYSPQDRAIILSSVIYTCLF
jgi:coatomer protein complex subunit alpha (xenin)